MIIYIYFTQGKDNFSGTGVHSMGGYLLLVLVASKQMVEIFIFESIACVVT